MRSERAQSERENLCLSAENFRFFPWVPFQTRSSCTSAASGNIRGTSPAWRKKPWRNCGRRWSKKNDVYLSLCETVIPHYTLELKGIMGYNCEKKTAVPTEKTGRRFYAGIKYVEKITDRHLGEQQLSSRWRPFIRGYVLRLPAYIS